MPSALASAFGAEFEKLIAAFATEQELIPEPGAIASSRFLSRSVVPHIRKLSSLFNREDRDQAGSLAPYWKESSNPAHLRLAYFLYFMPSNLYRVAAIWAELGRLGFRWPPAESFRAVEFGAGPATGACGIAAGERHSPSGLPRSGSWALIEQDRAMLELGARWAERYFQDAGMGDWSTRSFHRRIDLKQGFLPRTAPGFHLWLMSFYLNELDDEPAVLARALLESWERHLEDEGLAILVEPALKLQSRRLLELRRALLEEIGRRGSAMQLLLPCLGHQACGALSGEDDWCHEEVTWWRPPYFRVIDKMAGLDRKTLPFSYLVLAKSSRSREEILPALSGSARRFRLVSPSHREGPDLEFFLCGEDGKRRARFKPPQEPERDAKLLDRGDILLDPELRGDARSTRIDKLRKID